MRSPSEIRRLVLALRDRQKLTYGIICERSRCTREQVLSCLAMRATEDTLIKLDVFLDNPKLHKRPADTELLYEIERLSRMLWWQYKLKTPHPDRVALYSIHKQKILLSRLTAQGTALLQEKVKKEHDIFVRIPDGDTYWLFAARCKRRIQREAAVRAGNAYAGGMPRPSRLGQNWRLQRP